MHVLWLLIVKILENILLLILLLLNFKGLLQQITRPFVHVGSCSKTNTIIRGSLLVCYVAQLTDVKL